jgi:hypothetical protein
LGGKKEKEGGEKKRKKVGAASSRFPLSSRRRLSRCPKQKEKKKTKLTLRELEDVLLPVDDLERPPPHPLPDVPRVEPPLGVHALGRQLGLPVVAAEKQRPADAHLAAAARHDAAALGAAAAAPLGLAFARVFAATQQAALGEVAAAAHPARAAAVARAVREVAHLGHAHELDLDARHGRPNGADLVPLVGVGDGGRGARLRQAVALEDDRAEADLV